MRSVFHISRTRLARTGSGASSALCCPVCGCTCAKTCGTAFLRCLSCGFQGPERDFLEAGERRVWTWSEPCYLP